MYACVFSNFLFVFFLVSSLSCPSEVYLFFLWSAFLLLIFALFYYSLLFHAYALSYLQAISFPSLICLSASSLLADGTYPTFCHSALPPPALDVSLCCGVSHDLSLRDPMPFWDLPWRLSLLPLWNPCHLSTFSLFLFPRWLFLWFSASPCTLNTGCCSAL